MELGELEEALSSLRPSWESQSPNEYTEGDWTIRILDGEIEAFNSAEGGDGKYIKLPYTEMNLAKLLMELA